jgi:hypothetical protein
MALFLSHRLTNDASLAIIELRHARELAELVERNKVYLHRWLPWVPDHSTEDDARAFIGWVVVSGIGSALIWQAVHATKGQNKLAFLHVIV